MLSFEDDTPMTPTLGLQLLHSTPSGRTSPAQPTAPADTGDAPTTLGDVKAPPTHTRVRAEDKRVINAKTDVNQLVPLKYQWDWAKQLTGCADYCVTHE